MEFINKSCDIDMKIIPIEHKYLQEKNSIKSSEKCLFGCRPKKYIQSLYNLVYEAH